MRICSTCGKVLSDSDEYCSNCGKDKNTAEVQSVFSNPDDTPATPEPSAETKLASSSIFKPETKASQTSPKDQVLLTSEVSENAPLRSHPRVLKKLLAALLLLALLAGCVISVYSLLSSIITTPSDVEDSYFSYLSGSWLSDPFCYSVSDYPCREMLIIRENKTFVSSIIIANDSSASKTIIEIKTGTVSVDPETARLSFIYNDSGSDYSYSRYIRVLTYNSLTLREYYNTQFTDYYDVVFTKTEG